MDRGFYKNMSGEQVWNFVYKAIRRNINSIKKMQDKVDNDSYKYVYMLGSIAADESMVQTMEYFMHEDDIKKIQNAK